MTAVTAVAFFLFASTTKYESNGPDLEGLENAIPRLMRTCFVPGLVVALADREGPVWSRGYGMADAKTRRPVNDQTVFSAASLTKPLVAYATLKLVSEGILELDRPLCDYAPLPDVAHDVRHRRLTVRHVISHTTGLPNWRPPGGMLDFQSAPGARYGYSGEGFVLLGLVLEKVTDMSLSDVVRELVFEPLGMTRSTMSRRMDEENFAVAHDELGWPLERQQGPDVNAAASAFLTATDYARFLSAILRGEGLGEDLVREIATPQTEVGRNVWWGLGFALEGQPDGVALWQWGHQDGYRAFTTLQASSGRAFVFLSNSDSGMLMLRDLVQLGTGVKDHPAVNHLGYESHDSPRQALRQKLDALLQEKGIDAVLARVEEVHTSLSFEEATLNSIGYSLLRAQPPRISDAVALFERNTVLFPHSSQLQNSLGDGLRALGDNERAIEAYERAIARDPSNSSAARSIAELRRNKDA